MVEGQVWGVAGRSRGGDVMGCKCDNPEELLFVDQGTRKPHGYWCNNCGEHIRDVEEG